MGSVRSPKKGEQLLSVHPEWNDKLSFSIVLDYTNAGTWDETFKSHDFDYVVHVAAPLLDNPENVDFDKYFLEPSVKGYVHLKHALTVIETRNSSNLLPNTGKMSNTFLSPEVSTHSPWECPMRSKIMSLRLMSTTTCLPILPCCSVH